MTELIVQQVLNWLTLGSIYALIAVGFSLLFGVLNIKIGRASCRERVSPYV